MSAGHLTRETVGALVDRELEPDLERESLLHLQGCHACSLDVLRAHQMKAATKAAAGGRFLPSADAMEKMVAVARQPGPRRATVIPMRRLVWSAAAALVLFLVSVGAWRATRESNTLSAELLDQHLASLSDTSAPQVISTDRHTVKPWFQGKLAFSFNIPEAAALPPDTTLQGADLTYVAGKPAARLRFLIRKHRVSVFVTQAGALPQPGPVEARSGFNFDEERASGVDLLGVSDVSRADLSALMQILAKAQ